LRLLGWLNGDRLPGGSVIVSSSAGPVSIGHKEPAGHIFHAVILKQQGLFREYSALLLEAEGQEAGKAESSLVGRGLGRGKRT